ncbi:MAG: aldehyde dehydrogenase family protein, partial [Caldimonas sp.]
MTADASEPRHESMRIAGERVGGARRLEVVDPFTGRAVGSVPKATVDDVRRAFAIARAYQPRLTRFERAQVLHRTAELVRSRAGEIARLITSESGLCLKDSTYECGRVADVLVFGANECLKDDGQIFSCDLT